jgi:hypothetical protein
MEAVTTRAAVREEQLAAEAAVLRTELAALGLTNERLRADLRVRGAWRGSVRDPRSAA